MTENRDPSEDNCLSREYLADAGIDPSDSAGKIYTEAELAKLFQKAVENTIAEIDLNKRLEKTRKDVEFNRRLRDGWLGG